MNRLKEYLKPREKELVLSALQIAKGNRRRAARILGVSRTTLYNKMKQFGLPAKFGGEVPR